MTLPANIRTNMSAPFPATVKGGGAVTVSKANGIWTVQLNYGLLALQQALVGDPANSYVLVWNALTGVYTVVPMSAVSGSKVVKQLASAASPYTVLPTDEVLLIENVPFTVNVDWSTRTKALRVVDASGAASVGSPITITPAAGQTQLASVNYSYLIDGAGGSITLTPLPNQTGAY
jgi:hypothetical protein